MNGVLLVIRNVSKREKLNDFYRFFLFRIVRHDKLDKGDHYTISKLGVTHITHSEAEFTPLRQWEKDLHHYSQLIKIKTFANFRMWKAFYVWKKNVKGRLVVVLPIQSFYRLTGYLLLWSIQSFFYN